MGARSWVSAYGQTIDVTDLKNSYLHKDEKLRANAATVKTLITSLRMTEALKGDLFH